MLKIEQKYLQWKQERNKINTFSPSARFSRKSVSGFTYCDRHVILFVSYEWTPDPVKSMAVTLKPPSSRSAIVLYQHQAPNPPPWTRTKWLVSRSSSLISCNKKPLGKLNEPKNVNSKEQCNLKSSYIWTRKNNKCLALFLWTYTRWQVQVISKNLFNNQMERVKFI